MPRCVALFVSFATFLVVAVAHGQQTTDDRATTAQTDREVAFAKMLSGATLEGSFTVTSPGHDATQLSREKYTLGDVKKLDGNLWLIPTRIQYSDKDVQLPITLPIEWAGDTPLVVVDNLGLPGFGTVSARVMFFADHYAGYWQHGDAGGHLFGTIHRATAAHRDKAAAATAGESGK